jgi:hypothetical protein
MVPRHGWRLATVSLVVLCALFAVPGSALAKRAENHCLSPVGEDLNEALGTTDALVTPFCTEVRAGDRWRPVLRVAAAGSDYVFPSGYAPTQPALDEDFAAKLVSVRYVVDAGTAQERTYVFPATRFDLELGVFPGGVFVRWATPPLHPLPPGDHTVDEYVTLSADFWDGLDVDPTANLIPAGESLAVSVGFTVAV